MSRMGGGAAGVAGGVGGVLFPAALLIGGAIAARMVINRSRWMDLEGKVVLVTGGSRGLGLVLARQLIERGARVAICARDPDELERAARELEALGGDVQPVLCDITDRERVRAMVRDVEAGTGPIDVLINNAGVIGVGPFEEMAVEDFEREMATHFWGPLYVLLEVLPGMRSRGSGRVANITSIGAKVPVPHLAPYCASKFALAGLSGALRAELLRDGVYVTSVYPSLMKTGSHVQAEFKGRQEEEFAIFTWSVAAPGASVSAEHAAKRVIRAVQRGEAEAFIGVQALLAARAYELMPEWASDALALIGGRLPRGTGGARGSQRVKGWAVRSKSSDAAERFGGLVGPVERYGQVKTDQPMVRTDHTQRPMGTAEEERLDDVPPGACPT